MPPSKQCTCCASPKDLGSAPLLPALAESSRALKSKWPCLVLMEEYGSELPVTMTMSRGTCLSCMMRKTKCSFIDQPVEGLPVSIDSAPPNAPGNQSILATSTPVSVGNPKVRKSWTPSVTKPRGRPRLVPPTPDDRIKRRKRTAPRTTPGSSPQRSPTSPNDHTTSP